MAGKNIKTINFTTKIEHGKTVIEARPTPIFYEQDDGGGGRDGSDIRQSTETILAKEDELRDLEMWANAEGLLLSAKEQAEIDLLDKIRRGYERHLTAKITLDGELGEIEKLDNLTIRNRSEAIKQAEEKAGIKYPYHFCWLDGASNAAGVIEFPWDGYSKVYAVKGGYDNPEIAFLDEAKPGGRAPKKPYFERVDGKTIVYMDGFSGAGTEQEPFEVATAADLRKVGSGTDGWGLDKYYTQTADIDLSGYSNWSPIGNNANPFSGNFNGGGFKISNLKINRSTTDYQGLFGVTDSGAELTDITVDSFDIDAKGRSGGLVGWNNGKIINCCVSGFIEGNRSYVGGLTGYNFGEVHSSCSMGTVKNVISALGHYTGGLIGRNYDQAIVSNSYSNSVVDGRNHVGGLIGGNGYSTVSNCYSTGAASGTGDDVGGLVGSVLFSIVNSFWDTETSGWDTSASGIGKTTEEMQDIETYLDAGWDICEKADFDPDNPTTWFIDDGNDYPRLWHEWIPPAPPTVGITNVTRYTISAMIGCDVSTATFVADQDLTEFVARIADEPLDAWQEIYIIDAAGERHDFIFAHQNDRFYGVVKLAQIAVGIATIYARVRDTVHNVSALASKTIDVKEGAQIFVFAAVASRRVDAGTVAQKIAAAEAARAVGASEAARGVGAREAARQIDVEVR